MNYRLLLFLCMLNCLFESKQKVLGPYKKLDNSRFVQVQEIKDIDLMQGKQKQFDGINVNKDEPAEEARKEAQEARKAADKARKETEEADKARKEK
eukprot:TRINITY_DN49_c0_g2_i5.p1 TRINITY_DN49_c0_g2~~TRINITY_DN49_c0_g2_i5.p1  ORF type:complete len:96 (+),score=28.35 TRINITY_DN49_c0_g2_i5:52-339(+)